MGAAETYNPAVVRIACDTVHMKAGGTDPFAAPRYWPQWWPGISPFTAGNMRRAYRHGGAIPWIMVKERANPVTYTLTDPAAGSLYITEVPGHAFSIPPNWPTSPDWWDYDVKRKLDGISIASVGSSPIVLTATPNTVLAAYLSAATDADVATMMLRPEPPTLSADDWYSLSQQGEYHQFSGPSAVAAVGSMERMTLIKPTANGLNTKTTGAQVQYVCKLAAGSTRALSHSSMLVRYGARWNGTTWIIDKQYSTPFGSYYTCAQMYGGWNYAPHCDPATGAVAGSTSMPEGTAWNLGLRGAFDVNGYPPVAAAITWPTGVRKIGGTYGGSAGYGVPRLMWRPAEPWRARMAFIDNPTYRWSNVDGSSLGIGVFNGAPSFEDLWRGYYDNEAAASEDGTGAWNTLCTFPSWTTGDLGNHTWGGTLPAAGQEIIITAWHSSMHFTSSGDGQVRIYFYPDATVSPVAIPLALGGAVQGGSL